MTHSGVVDLTHGVDMVSIASMTHSGVDIIHGDGEVLVIHGTTLTVIILMPFTIEDSVIITTQIIIMETSLRA